MIVKVGAIIAQSTQKLIEFKGQGTQGGKLDTGALLTAQIDAIALLGHTNYELSLRRREAIKPNRICNLGQNLFVFNNFYLKWNIIKSCAFPVIIYSLFIPEHMKDSKRSRSKIYASGSPHSFILKGRQPKWN